MGNGISCGVTTCFSGGGRRRHRHVAAAVTSEPLDEGLGHSFCYVSSKIANLDESPNTTINNNSSNLFYSISGASVSANTSTALSTSLDPYSSCSAAAAAFDCSNSFASVPLQPLDRGGGNGSGGFMSGPIERSYCLSGPLDNQRALFSGPIDFSSGKHDSLIVPRNFNFLRRSFSYGLARKSYSLFRGLSKTIKNPRKSSSADTSSGSISLDAAEDPSVNSGSLQWAQGRAGEDRVHVVVSEEDDWVFVGIYDGFNGPDATDYLLSNLYPTVQHELHGCCRGHFQVLKALSRAMKKTESAYFGVADKMSAENPELALMGSCVLVMLMKGENLYLMNVGDSRAVLGRKPRCRDEETDELVNLKALQLTMDHSTSVEEEVIKIRNAHPDDSSAIMNHRVKGSLKVTRAFGAGFLKQPKWNNALLEMFRIDYVGTSPYITCSPYLYHHTLGPRDRFLILSSDGLYQYFTNDEVVAEVELFIATTPEGDPAQHLVEELLFRAAKKAGMDFHELLAIPQGDRRQYHDDVSVIVLSLEGRIWRSCV